MPTYADFAAAPDVCRWHTTLHTTYCGTTYAALPIVAGCKHQLYRSRDTTWTPEQTADARARRCDEPCHEHCGILPHPQSRATSTQSCSQCVNTDCGPCYKYRN